jgi:hypothetical protein
MTPRFRLNVFQDRDGFWIVSVFDLLDHGEDVCYAQVESKDVVDALRQAAHYVMVAA